MFENGTEKRSEKKSGRSRIPSGLTHELLSHHAHLMNQPVAPEKSGMKRLSAELLAFSESIHRTDVSLGEIIAQLEGRVYTFLLVILSLPFCQPIALPGLSTPFGVVIALLGLRFAFRKKPWLPKRLLDLRIPKKIFPAILKGSAKVLTLLERLLHPRWTWVFDWKATQAIAGLTIFSCGLLLLLPLPLPFSNLLPAATVVLLASAFSERDGLMLWLGGVFFMVTLGFFLAVVFGSIEVIGWLEGHFGGFFDPQDEAPGVTPITP